MQITVRPAFIFALCMLALLTLMVSACNTEENQTQNQHPAPPASDQPEKEQPIDSPKQEKEPDDDQIDPLEEKIQQMTLQEKIGQLVIAGVNGYEPDASDIQLIEQFHVGGFIFFDRNIQDAGQWANLVQTLKEKNAEQGNIPLFLGVDEEGGRVSRIPEPYISMPDNATIGQKENPELAFQIGELLAEQVRMFGMNINFAPVLDVASNPDNPVIGDRSFSSDPDIVSSLGVQTMWGMQEQGMIPVLKHFPGHGDTTLDSHIELPVVEHDRDRLSSVEWKPFQYAIEQGADAVMTAHILFPQLDPDLPATLSPVLLTNVLREELGFKGVIITDDLTMGAIVNHYDIGEAAVQSLFAGSDILLVCHGHDEVKRVLETIQQEVQHGKLREARIDESVYRILQLKTEYEIDDHSTASVISPEVINEQIQQIMSQTENLDSLSLPQP